jgi:hypothetical protein
LPPHRADKESGQPIPQTNVVGPLVEPFSDSLHKEFTGQPNALIALTPDAFS